MSDNEARPMDLATSRRPPGTAPAPGRSHKAHADEAAQRAMWIAFFVGMGLFMTIGVAAGIGREAGSGEALPPPPATTR
ncbi:MAG: hypothetical protein K0R38_3001 [Polyangiaceae bacterium]|jgi:hypothetical protein|nr:hypothetical protein [Polyangiaceae bacterium]